MQNNDELRTIEVPDTEKMKSIFHGTRRPVRIDGEEGADPKASEHPRKNSDKYK
jgi:hypothetical protein